MRGELCARGSADRGVGKRHSLGWESYPQMIRHTFCQPRASLTRWDQRLWYSTSPWAMSREPATAMPLPMDPDAPATTAASGMFSGGTDEAGCGPESDVRALGPRSERSARDAGAGRGASSLFSVRSQDMCTTVLWGSCLRHRVGPGWAGRAHMRTQGARLVCLGRRSSASPSERSGQATHAARRTQTRSVPPPPAFLSVPAPLGSTPKERKP